MAITSIVYLKQ